VRAQARVLAAGGMGSVYPGVPEMLQFCHRIGLSLALGAECNRDFLLAVCDCHGFDSVFDLMACTQDYGSGGLFELLEDLTERFETHTSECVYLGTRAVCLEAATALGVTSLGCRWGLRGAFEVGRADRQADRPEEITAVLQEIDLQLKDGET
jgi:phosphoglycolate phosphatase-like HAD superfamily hydrolase